MNSGNPFGSPHGGAFQAPSSSAKPSLFPNFGPQNSSSQGQSSAFFQPPAFGQPPSMNQPTVQSSSIFGQSIIRQTPAFGQTGGQTQTSAFGQAGGQTQTSAFGQTGGQTQTSAFGQAGGQTQTSAFGQAGGQTQTSAFGQNQTPAFGQTGGQNQTPAFGQTGGQNPNSAFGQTGGQNQTPAFGQTGGQNQTPAFGQTGGQNPNSAFGQTGGQNPNSAFGQTGGQNQTPAFGQTSGQNPNSAFGQTGGQNPHSAFGKTTGKTQTAVFGQSGGHTQTSIFGQTAGQNQTSIFGQTQTSAFGQTGGQTQIPSFGQTQTSSFGQTGGQTQTPSFGQTGGQTQTPSFGQTGGQNQTPTFGQAGGQNQTSAFGQTGGQNQTPAFGQTGGQIQTATFGQLSEQTQTTTFGQVSGQTQTAAFGQVSGQTQTSAFGQTGGQTQTSAFGQTGGQTQTSAFGQPSAFGQAPGFGKPPPAYGSSKTTVSSTGGFGQPSSTGAFGGAQNVTQSRTAGSSAFCFKPAREALFKPIFSASSEPANTQVTTKSSSSFGGGVQTSLSTTSFALLAGTKSGPLDFTFSQPAAAASISAPTNQPTAASSSGATDTIQLTVSQPGASSSSSTSASTTEPTTTSFFSFTTKTLQTQPTFSGGAGFSQPPAFDGNKGKAESSTDEKGSKTVSLEDTNVFARLGKAIKRKDDPAALSSVLERPTAEESVPTEADSPRHPSKRPLIRSRGLPGGLFSRALTGIRKERVNMGRKDVSKEIQKPALALEGAEEAEGDEPFATPASAPTTFRDVLDKPEGSGVTQSLESSVSTPVSRGSRRDSLDSLSGLSPNDLTSIMCRNVPHALNKKDVIEKHFARFGRVRKVFCRPAKNMSIVHFDDHAAAAKAKKKGKVLHRHELLLLWQKKKQSPGERGSRSAGGNEETVPSQEVTESRSAESPLRRQTLMPPKLGSSVTISRSSPVMKPSPVKVLQFDTEPQKENVAESQSSEHPVPSSLVHLLGQVTETAEEKYRLLEQRDKILRQGRPKRTDLDMSKVFVGTCPDMCPEKERYMRETRNQLSVFEVIPNTEMVDHAAAIKEYSRSSADQEEPLPHELRPLPVLTMTMDYLVTQIMDQVQDNHRDWYDFVWNRTRGIRKDITQQRLCCPHTVSLIEKCTRFHVHCAHHLCEEPMSSFDTKINNENMTKCLQSLKEMYEDLAAQHISCPQEAEFRQYSVLLKLNDGDILREVQQFRDGVRNSPEVKFAVQAFTSVNSNNFVRFFKLVKGASYLSSCLLHRYFNQVRAKALKTLNMAHTVGPRSTLFPVEDVVRMLMFRNAAEATDFIQQYGLNVNDGMVELSRIAFQEPELPLSLKRSEVILAKKTVLIGQVVNGGPLPNPPQHVPVCSFDSQNKYRGDGRLAESAVRADGGGVPAPPAFDPSAQFVPIKPPELPPVLPDETGGSYHPAAQPLQPEPARPPSPPPKPQPVYSDEDVVAELDSVIEEVVQAEVKDVADVGASYAAAALLESNAQVETLVKEVLGQMLQEISSSEIKLERERVAEEKRKLEEARRKQEHEAFLAQFSCSLCTEVVHEVLDETIKDIAASEIQEALNEKAERFANCTEQICCSLVEETLSTEISLLVEGVLETELERIHKYIKRWRDVVAVRRQLKRQMRGFPAAPCCVDPRFKLKALAPSAPAQPSVEDLARGLVNLGNAGLLAVSSTRLLRMREEVLHQMRVHFYYQQLLEETVWAPLDLPALVTENIPDPPERIFWKALLLLPADHESVASLADRVLSDWLEVKLGGDVDAEDQPDGTMKTLCVTNTLQYNGQRTHKVHVTVKASRAPLTELGLSKVEDLSELQGTGALIMLLPAQSIIESGQEDQDVPLLSALLQLKQLQQVNAWHCPLPLVVLVPGCEDAADTQKLAEALSLQTLMEEDFISEVTFFFIPETTSDLQGSKQLTQALRWLLARAPPPFLLSCQTLVQLIEASLSRDFSPRVYANRQDRAAARLPPQDPAPVVQLYNAVLDHVADKVDSPGLCRLSWPPAEFSLPETRDFVPYVGWNSELHLTWLRDAILSLKLPEWEELPATDSWRDLCSSIFSYAAKIPTSRRSQPLLVSRLENLLERVKIKARRTRTTRSKRTSVSPDDEVQDVCPAFIQIPWDDVLVVFIDHKLKDWQLPGPPVCKDAVTEDGEILVYVPAGSLDGFQPPEEWTQAVEHTHRAKQQDGDGETDAASAPPASPSLRQRLFHSSVEPIEESTPPLDITHTLTAEELRAYKVLQSLEEEKAESQRNMEQLQRLLDGDPLDHFSTPLFIPSSTLLFTPTVVKCPPTDGTRGASSTQKSEPDERRDRAAWSKSPPVSLTRRLKDLERQILANREEERTCRLKLTGLLSIVDD